MMNYRLGLDMGSTSLGWCVVELKKDEKDERYEPVSIVDMGVRIFTDGRDDKSKEPLSVQRRMARGMRRNRDRKKMRLSHLLHLLSRNGLFPEDEEARLCLQNRNPYELRAKAAEEKVDPHELGRALVHIAQRRGFKSNRKTDKKEIESNQKEAIQKMEKELEGHTLGTFLWGRLKKDSEERVRVRVSEKNYKAVYDYFPTRAMYEEELRVLLTTQAQYYPERLTDALQKKITEAIIWQRPLKKPLAGYCTFEQGEKRARKAYPLSHKFRILQEVSNLEVGRASSHTSSLSPEEKAKIIEKLSKSEKCSFKALRTLLHRKEIFNLERNREELKGDKTGAILSGKRCFGDRWWSFSEALQTDIVEALFEEEDPEELRKKLIVWGIEDEKKQEAVMEASLDAGYGALSVKAMRKILPFLEQGMRYDEAAKEAGYHHSDFRTDTIYERLPYYGEVLPRQVIGGSKEEEDRDVPEKYYGKINNPSVHVALNQLRKLVNALVDRYGPPQEVIIELLREVQQSAEEIMKEQRKNRKENTEIDKELKKAEVSLNYANRMKYKLWEDLAKDPMLRACPFCGETISVNDIFNFAIEVEHLIPFSRCFQDSRSNKVLSHRSCNREKGNRTPAEAFSHDAKRWEGIQHRVEKLPKNKQRRFSLDAMGEGEGKEGMIARLLNDSRYMSRIAREYLEAFFEKKEGKQVVKTNSGQMTSLVRYAWGLNGVLGQEDKGKNREDHRHHAVDALVIACTDGRMLRKIQNIFAGVEKEGEGGGYSQVRREAIKRLEPPFENLWHQVWERTERMVVSHKPDHGNAHRALQAKRPYTTSALHEETAYGRVGGDDAGKRLRLVHRKSLDSMESRKHIEEIVSPIIQEELEKRLAGVPEKSTEWKESLRTFREEKGVRSVRVLHEKFQTSMIPIAHPLDRGPKKERGKVYKYYQGGNNYCAEIYCPDKGKKAGTWKCEVISSYHAHQKDFIPRWRRDHPTAKLVMRLYKQDLVAYEEGERTVIARVKKLSTSANRVSLREHHIAKEEGDTLSWGAFAGGLQKKHARKISVDILGRVRDPQSRDRPHH